MSGCVKRARSIEKPESSDEEILRQFDLERSAILARMEASNIHADDHALLFSTAESLQREDELRLRILRTLLDELEFHRSGEPKDAASAIRARISDLVAECRHWIE